MLKVTKTNQLIVECRAGALPPHKHTHLFVCHKLRQWTLQKTISTYFNTFKTGIAVTDKNGRDWKKRGDPPLYTLRALKALRALSRQK